MFSRRPPPCEKPSPRPRASPPAPPPRPSPPHPPPPPSPAPPPHPRQSAQSAPRRPPLRRPKSQPLDHLARPLAIESRRVHHHRAMISVPPHNRNNHAMPERPNAPLPRSVHALRMLPAEHFVAQRRPQQANNAIDCRGDHRNLYPPRPRQLRQPPVVVRFHCLCAIFATLCTPSAL